MSIPLAQGLARIVASAMVVTLVACGDDGDPLMAMATDAGPPVIGDAGASATMADGGSRFDPEVEPCSERVPRMTDPEVFTGPHGLATRLTDLMGTAQNTLRVSIYQLDSPHILAALEAAARRGVEVRLNIDGQRYANRDTIPRLRRAGIDVNEASLMFEHYHGKTILIDDEVAVVMSANMNEYSMTTERNHGVVLHDRWDFADLSELFEADFVDGAVPVDLSCTRLVISPNNSATRVHAHIESAARELRMQMMYIDDAGIEEKLVARSQAGVAIRLILADPRWIADNAATGQRLREAGIEVRYLRTMDNHAKLILADSHSALVGSVNMSSNSLTRNREVGVVVTAASAVDELAFFFEADWEAATP